MDEVASIAGTLSAGLFFVLTGEDEAGVRLIGDDRGGVSALSAALETAPPVVEAEHAELRAAVTAILNSYGAAALVLRDASATPVIDVAIDLVPDPWFGGLRPVIVGGARRPEVAPTTHRGPDDRGRLPREAWIGGSALRLNRLFATDPDRIECLEAEEPTGIEMAFLLDYADGDIHNGGLHQFYGNSTGNFAGRFPDFAARIGAVRRAEIVTEANRLFAGVDLADRDERNARLDGFAPEAEAALGDLTGRYHEIDDEPVRDLLVAHIERDPGPYLC